MNYMNGPIQANGFVGDACIRMSQKFSCISWDLVGGLQLRLGIFNCEMLGRKSGSKLPYVNVELCFGEEGKKVVDVFAMIILEGIEEELIKTSGGLFRCMKTGEIKLPEVIVGRDFLERTDSEIAGKNYCMKSKLYGVVPYGSFRPFTPNTPNVQTNTPKPRQTRRDVGDQAVERLNNDLSVLKIKADTRLPERIDANNNAAAAYEIKSFTSGSGNCNQSYRDKPDDRVIMLFDLDCFEVQVHQKQEQIGKPRVVANSSGRILAVSYEAKQLGISRALSLRAAKQMVPTLIEIQVPTREKGTYSRGKPRPNTMIALEASARIKSAIKHVIAYYKRKGKEITFEYASNDEYFVEITDLLTEDFSSEVYRLLRHDVYHKTFLYNGEQSNQRPTPEYIFTRLRSLERRQLLSPLERQELRLIFGAAIANQFIKEVLKQTGYQTSVGIASNKLVAKMASGIHKPGAATILAPSGYEQFSKVLKISDIPGLGGKTGEILMNKFNAKTVWDLSRIPVEEIANCELDENRLVGRNKAEAFGTNALCICNNPVLAINFPKTSGVSMTLNGKQSEQDLKDIIFDLCCDLHEKLTFEENFNRRVAISAKLYLKQKGGNMHSKIDLSGSIKNISIETLFLGFLNSCNPTILKCRDKVCEKCEISANF